jgi:tetratricopeptide repeat protein
VTVRSPVSGLRSPVSGLLLLLSSCSAPATPAALARAESVEHGGQDASAAYAEAARVECDGKAKSQRWCAASLRGLAESQLGAGRRAEAAATYERLPAYVPGLREDGAAALAAAAAIHLDSGEDARAYDLWWRVIVEYPEASAADDAVRNVVADGRTRNARQLYGTLRDLYARLATTAVGDNLLWALATLAHEDLHDDAAALAACDRMTEAHAGSPLVDDALWLGAALARAGGDPAGAAKRLRRLLATRESSFFIGSYLSPHLPEAQLELARLLRDELARPREAIAELRRLPRDYPKSTLRDDALWEEAVTEERLGDRAAACAAAAQLHQQFPESRYELEDGPALRARLACR